MAAGAWWQIALSTREQKKNRYSAHPSGIFVMDDALTQTG
jgi:hypothetical protein